MKNSTFFALIGASIAVTPVFAVEPVSKDALAVQETLAKQSAIVEQVAKDVAASPKKAGEIVKAAILKSKADAVTVAQIVKVAVLAAPEQTEMICKCAFAVAPDAQKEIKLMLAALDKGDQVAGTSTVVPKEPVHKKLDKKKNASNEPEGDREDENVVWLDNKGAAHQGGQGNPLDSWTQNTANSPNVNHNQFGLIEGGGTVVGGVPIVVGKTTETNN